ncbi:MAG TPA: phosphoribosylformylglycinamidine synthase subunit PurL [Bacteroidota bacterium]|nr:phosphoribosylformylglycinamidine synthase subunit PurL [Bacteroidota bacterium]
MKQEPEVTLESALQHGLTEDEYTKVKTILGRTPTYTELGIYSVMWSEHCSYKNSIAQLKTLPRSGGRLLVGAGEENAGLVDIGDGLAVAFKIESHNHPSAVEPYQGAATGVGGIMRDIFTMGARPIAGLNSLRFGGLDHTRTRFLFKGVVKGIGDYGNSFGVPTVAGEVYFDPCYQTNPLVNAMSVGIVKHNQVASAVAKGKGNTVMIVGASTGRDGIHGATFASEEISEKSEAKRPSVQVGDPFTEKLLLEATLEVIHMDYLVGIQDMGAAGITCSTMEMSAKGESGMIIDLDKVPVRESGMSAYEIMLSESQERMLLVSKPGMEEKIKEVFAKWDLHCVAIGTVTDDGIVRISHHGELKAEVPAETLVLGGGAPVYIRETAEPQYLKEVRRVDVNSVPEPSNYADAVMALLRSPNIAGKRWVYEQYDSMVRTNTILYEGCDAAVVKIKDTSKYLSMKTDCNGRYVYLNPKKGAMIAVAESARNVVCSGGTPLAITNCLNFGNPYKPEMYWQFTQAVEGVGEACRAFETPVTGGNVSFYNESPTAAVYPTPVIGMVGLIEDKKFITPSAFQAPGDAILLLGTNRGDLNGSEYLASVHGICGSDAPWFDMEAEKRVQACALELIHAGLIRSAHDVSDGGIIVTLIESAICGGGTKGFTVELGSAGQRKDRVIFGEDQSRIVMSAYGVNLSAISAICERHNVPFSQIGVVTDESVGVVKDCLRIDLNQARDVVENEIGRRMDEVITPVE